MSCSSTAPNGCATCGPSFILFAISAGASYGIIGAGCLNGASSKVGYLSVTNSNRSNAYGQDSPTCMTYNQSCNISSSSVTNVDVDKYGVIFTSTSASFSYSDNGGGSEGCGQPSCAGLPCQKENPPSPKGYNDSFKAGTIPREDSCGEDKPYASDSFGYPNDCYACEPVFSKQPTITVTCTSSTCSAADGSSTSGCPCPTTCIVRTCIKDNCGSAGSTPCVFPAFTSSGGFSGNSRTALGNAFSLERALGLCRQSTAIQMSNLKTNRVQGCKGQRCGSGGVDDCWGGTGGSFTLSADGVKTGGPAVAQEIEFKIATLKDTFDTNYISAGGAVFFYTPTSEDSEEGRTPCCSENFQGTIHRRVPFQISRSSPTFKGIYLATNLTRFSNSNQSLAGKGIQSCISIENVLLKEN